VTCVADYENFGRELILVSCDNSLEVPHCPAWDIIQIPSPVHEGISPDYLRVGSIPGRTTPKFSRCGSQITDWTFPS